MKKLTAAQTPKTIRVPAILTPGLPRGVWVTVAPGIKVMQVPLWTDRLA